MAIEYCPTDEMLADMFMKPLESAAFCKFQGAILNLQADKHICPAMVPMLGHRSVLGKLRALFLTADRPESQMDSDGTKQVAGQVAQANVANVETKNELRTHSF